MFLFNTILSILCFFLSKQLLFNLFTTIHINLFLVFTLIVFMSIIYFFFFSNLYNYKNKSNSGTYYMLFKKNTFLLIISAYILYYFIFFYWGGGIIIYTINSWSIDILIINTDPLSIKDLINNFTSTTKCMILNLKPHNLKKIIKFIIDIL